MLKQLTAFLICSLVATGAYGWALRGAGNPSPIGSPPSLTGIGMSGNTFTCGTAGNVSTVIVSGTGSLGATALTVGGPDAAYFTLSPTTGTNSNLQVGASPPGCPRTYQVTVTATLAGATGSPISTPTTNITGSNPVGGATLTGISLSGNTFVCGSAGTVGTVTVTGTGSISATTLSLTGTDSTQFTLSPTTGTTATVSVGASPAGCPRAYGPMTLTATLAGATGSPQSTSVTLTGNSPSALCPYAGTATTDGCSGAPVANANTIQHADFFTSYALQNGQTYKLANFTGSISGGVLTISGVVSGVVVNLNDTIIGGSPTIPAGVFVSSLGTGTGGNGTYNLANAAGVSSTGTMNALRRPPWNVAGVDYPVGINNGVTLKDPATTLPACGSTFPPPICNSSANYGDQSAVIMGANPTVDSYDFSLEGGWHVEYAGSGPTGTVTVTNNKFAAGSTYSPGGLNYCGSTGCNTSFFEVTGPNLTSLVVKNNIFDAHANQSPWAGTMNYIVAGITGGDITQYNAVLNMSARQNFRTGGVIKYNYYDGENYNDSYPHGEFTTFAFGSGGNYERTSGSTISGTTLTIGTVTESLNTPAPGWAVYGAGVTPGTVIVSGSGSVWTVNNSQSVASEVIDLSDATPINLTFDYNTALEPTSFVAGLTSLFYLSNGTGGGQWQTMETNNNTMVNNMVAMPTSAITGSTFTWNLPQFCISSPANAPVCSSIKTCSGTMTSISVGNTACNGSSAGGPGYTGGAWSYTGTLAISPPANVYVSVTGQVPITNGSHVVGDFGYAANWTCNNNYSDNSGTRSWSVSDACYQYTNAKTFTSTGNVAMPQ